MLLVAGAAEVGGVISMKASHGFKRLKPTVFAVLFGLVLWRDKFTRQRRALLLCIVAG